MPFFSIGKRPSAKVVLDVAEDGVQGTVVKRDDKGGGDISLYKSPKHSGTGGLVVSLSDLSFSVESVMDDIVQAGKVISGDNVGFDGHLLSDFLFVLNGSFQHSYLDVVSLENVSPIKISDAFIEDILAKEAPKRPEGPFLNLWDSAELKFIERRVDEVVLNGYPARSIEGKHARHIEISVFNVVIPKTVSASIEGLIKKRFRSNKVCFFSGPQIDLLFLETARKDSRGSYSYVNVDISETQIMSFDKNKPEDVITFAKGYIDMIMEVSERFDVSYNVSNSYISLYLSGKGEREFSNELKDPVSTVLEDWEREYEIKIRSAPRSVYFNCKGSLEPTFRGILSKKHPESEIVTLRDLYAHETGSSIETDDTRLAVDSYVLNRVNVK